jgi:hypothetical protein
MKKMKQKKRKIQIEVMIFIFFNFILRNTNNFYLKFLRNFLTQEINFNTVRKILFWKMKRSFIHDIF